MFSLLFDLCRRYFSVGSRVLKNYYNVLRVPPNATQAEIKAAYYKLSMIYHPDRNQGSKQAAEKFQLITAAYEILGNHDKRRRYDKGFLSVMDTDYDDDVFNQESISKEGNPINQKPKPAPTGRTPVYNYDEWSRSHYGQSFARRTAAKKEFNHRENTNIETKRENAVLGMFILVALWLFVFASFDNELDQVHPPPKKSKPLTEDEPKKN